MLEKILAGMGDQPNAWPAALTLPHHGIEAARVFSSSLYGILQGVGCVAAVATRLL